MSDGRMPIARTLVLVDRGLSLLVLIVGLIIMYLAIKNWNAGLALVSLIFLSIGFIKLRDVVPGMFRTIRLAGTAEEPAYRKVLLPISRLEAIESMVRLASDVISPGGRLALVNVVEIPPQLPSSAEVKKDNARALLRVATDLTDKLGLETSAEIVSARTASEAIMDRAKEYRSDLIIMGSSQRTVTEKVIFGNVADVVLRHAPCDVMVLSYTNRQHPVKYDRILVPTAGYRHSQRALDVAMDIIKKGGGTITSLYVGQDADTDRGYKILEAARARTEKSGIRSDAKFLTGNVADAIINTAKEGDYALIIIGATEHPKYYSALLGNIADHVVRRAPCDVLVVRTKR